MFGFAIANIASSVGADVKTIDLGYDQTISDWDQIEQAIAQLERAIGCVASDWQMDVEELPNPPREID